MTEAELKFKIKEVYEQGGQLRVIVETKYGISNLGLQLEQQYLNPITEEPRYMEEVKKLIWNKYKKAVRKDVFKETWEKTHTINGKI